MGILLIPDRLLGHETVEWQKGDKAGLEKVEKTFEEKIKDGWCAFKEVRKKWVHIDKFDSRIKRILLLPIGKAVGG